MALEEWTVRELASQGALAGGMGMLGRMLALAASTKRPIGLCLLWEIPMAIGMGVVGKGIADAFGLTGFSNFAAIIAVSYTGPRLIDIALARYAEGKSIKNV